MKSFRALGAGLLPVVVLTTLGACVGGGTMPAGERRSDTASTAVEPADVRSDDISLGIRNLIDQRDQTVGLLSAKEWATLEALYPGSAPVPLWLDAAGRPAPVAFDALALLLDAPSDGLSPADYAANDLHGRAAAVRAGEAVAAIEGARLEVALSSAILRFLRDLHVGRVEPSRIGFRLDRPPDPDDLPALLRGAVARGRMSDVAAELRPYRVQYDPLRAMLIHYRALVNDPALRLVQAGSKTVHPGEPLQDAANLRRLLAAFGDAPDRAAGPDVDGQADGRYDQTLVDGVRAFQGRHGLTADGVLGLGTWRALRVPLEWRTRQIELALERLRWLPHATGRRLIVMNIPMFRLWAWDTLARPPALTMDVIVGRALDTQTPVFVETLNDIVFRPYWNVPQSILRQETLPAIERDPGYLARENMEIVRGGGDDAAPVEPNPAILDGLRRGTYRVRQRPGPGNALGLAKFVLPNEENVYMHGTPAQTLFARDRRDFSHGCVRVADPVTLAEWVLRGQPEWNRTRIVAATEASATLRVTVRDPVDVVLFYSTAAVMPETGALWFADDIYGHDRRLDAALSKHRKIR